MSPCNPLARYCSLDLKSFSQSSSAVRKACLLPRYLVECEYQSLHLKHFQHEGLAQEGDDAEHLVGEERKDMIGVNSTPL